MKPFWSRAVSKDSVLSNEVTVATQMTWLPAAADLAQDTEQ